jgi:hypothetical protein
MTRRVGVTGGRDFNDADLLDATLSQHCAAGDILVHGNAVGADRDAALWFYDKGLPTEPHNADWGRFGKAAGPIRNQEMVDSGLDLLIAFSGGRGTADMVRRARAAGVVVVEARGT